MSKATARADLRKAIFEDFRGHIAEWPAYLNDFSADLTNEEIQAELDRALTKLKPKQS